MPIQIEALLVAIVATVIGVQLGVILYRFVGELRGEGRVEVE